MAGSAAHTEQSHQSIGGTSDRDQPHTIKDHLAALVERGQLTRHGAGRGTWYALV